MSKPVRRVVTGHDANGKAIVVSDGPAPFVHTDEKRPGYQSTDVWRTSEMPARIVANAPEPTLGPRRQQPTSRGTVIRVNRIEPETDAIRNLSPEEARKVFAGLGNEGASTHGRGGRHPMMHRTETVDYALILSGEIVCMLDDTEVLLKAGDVLVQVGTNHAWSNRSNTVCEIAFVLVDGEFDPALAATLPRHD
ncbi:MAG: cupin domain-containing protein [Burkholderiales bacterium]